VYKRLIILSMVIVAAVGGLGGLGYHAIGKWAQGLEGARLGEFAEVAEQIRQDVKRKLDDFIQAEQQRKYTDYLYYYVPENAVAGQQALPVLRSPLGDQLSNGFAYGYFQIEPGGNVATPYYQAEAAQPQQQNEFVQEAQRQEWNVTRNVLPLITRRAGMLQLPPAEARIGERDVAASSALGKGVWDGQASEKNEPVKQVAARSKAYPIESLHQKAQASQILTQQRSIAASNFALPPAAPQIPTADRARADAQAEQMSQELAAPQQQAEPVVGAAPLPAPPDTQFAFGAPGGPQAPAGGQTSDTVQIRVEPFVPVVVPGANAATSVFGGQVFLLRHVEVENRHLLQGFQLDEGRLIGEVEESAGRFMREGMGFDLPQVRQATGKTGDPNEKPAYTALLDFGFGDLALNLKETDPTWLTKRIGGLHQIYFAIIATVVLAVGLALASLWHNVRAQVALAAKKDEFISAVSHELRTPLTSIRMYAEMLEKNWIQSADKLTGYYRTMRQESERLSRLVENVLDFARLQKGRKRYAFELGDVNACVTAVAEMMRPYAEQRGFVIATQLGPLSETSFDRDAVTQIVVNLIDNAVKYAAGAGDKTITIRTRGAADYALIEVEDHGPGIPHRQRKKVFEQFYRYGPAPAGQESGPARSPTTTTGTGLGLTLVKRFAEAHGGYVEILSAEPAGVILRVALAAHARGASC
jgi:signal transduction histidine kinase